MFETFSCNTTVPPSPASCYVHSQLPWPRFAVRVSLSLSLMRLSKNVPDEFTSRSLTRKGGSPIFYDQQQTFLSFLPNVRLIGFLLHFPLSLAYTVPRNVRSRFRAKKVRPQRSLCVQERIAGSCPGRSPSCYWLHFSHASLHTPSSV